MTDQEETNIGMLGNGSAAAARHLIFLFGSVTGLIASFCLAAVIVMMFAFSNTTEVNSERLEQRDRQSIRIACKQAVVGPKYLRADYKKNCAESKAALKKFGD